MRTIRELLKQSISNIEYSTIQDWWVENHTSCSEQWVEVYPDGSWHVAEEASSNTSHYIEYPNKPVASIYEIANSSSQYCDCWVCKCWDDYNNDEITDEEFEEEYEFTRGDMENDTFESLVVEYNHNNDVYESEVIDEMLEAIDNIEYGYFDDEF